jgi:diguanylate cyclase (GGDEF)-like protein
MPGARKGRRKLVPSSNEDELSLDEPTLDNSKGSQSSDLDSFASEVVKALIKDNLPPTPNNYSLYFDRLLENKNEEFKKQVHSILELEESNDAENTIILEQSLKQGFVSIKNILGVAANMYKNMTLMAKILDKRKKELLDVADSVGISAVAKALEGDVSKLNTILKRQSSQIKELYDETGSIVKKVEQESIFDNKYGVYNKRYLFAKIEKEIELVKEFKHSSSLLMIELSKDLKNSVHNEKIITLMTRTVSRLLLKTSRRSDIIAHYGKGIFVMLLKHTDIESAKKASERLCDLVSNSNFFLADREILLKISVGITEIDPQLSAEEIVVNAMEAVSRAHENKTCYQVEVKNIENTK